jgi:hypothetical protein
MVNITQDIYDYLTGVTAVTDLAGARIWGDRSTPPKTYRPDDGPAMLFSARGGLPAYDARVLRVSYKFKFYGSTADPAVSPQLGGFNLYAATHDALQDAVFGHVRYSGAEIVAQHMEEFALNWPFILAFFEFIALNG